MRACACAHTHTGTQRDNRVGSLYPIPYILDPCAHTCTHTHTHTHTQVAVMAEHLVVLKGGVPHGKGGRGGGKGARRGKEGGGGGASTRVETPELCVDKTVREHIL